MKEKGMRIDLLKLLIYILKRSWILIICAIIGFGAMYYYTAFCQDDTYTTSGTMYVYNANPNTINYQYANSNDNIVTAKGITEEETHLADDAICLFGEDEQIDCQSHN